MKKTVNGSITVSGYHDASKKWLTAEEAAAYLRKKVKTLYNLRSQGKLTGTRSGGAGSLLFTVEELDTYILGKRRNYV